LVAAVVPGYSVQLMRLKLVQLNEEGISLPSKTYVGRHTGHIAVTASIHIHWNNRQH
jgi:hypothetical protein